MMHLAWVMGSFSFSFFFLICCTFLPSFTFSEPHTISPNFTSTNIGTFLLSQNGNFKATIDAKPPSSDYYFSIAHTITHAEIWTANRNAPMSSSDKLSLTTNGLIVTNQTGQVLWSTPFLTSKVAAMQLLDTGNLVLVDAGNAKLWESFDYPTDAIVVGQRIPVGKSLESSVSEDDMSLGDYRLEVTDRDVVLQWNRMDYWNLSSNSRALKNSNGTVSWMVMNDTALYLLGSDGSTVVIQVPLNGPPGIKIGRLGPDGRFTINSFNITDEWVLQFAGPFEDCKIPFICRELGLCAAKPLGGICSCPPGFHRQIGGGNCVPENTSLSLPSACNGSQLNSSISYLKLGPGFYHENASGSCYLLENHLGSFSLTPFNNPRLGKNRLSKIKTVKQGQFNSSSSEELEMISIPGLPRRFDYEELAAATENFKTLIGSGGFGTVYRGTLSDKTVVAVKKITNLGVQGKREFCTEISIIGNIHHVNLVRLKGFCAQGRQRFLVLEYMNRGSLGSTLFGNGPVLEWRERLEIALGTARGLAYLHSECEHRIIHCDVKPENILLHDNLQVKISDFGLSKLLNPDQSALFTTMRGTRGYLAPEWLTSSAIYDKADVYSYGMVLLEIVRGRKNCSLQRWSHSTKNSSSEGSASSTSSISELRPIYFPLFALQMHEQRRYLELADPRLEGRVTSEEVEKLVRIALCCVHEDPMLRPTMANVVGMLEGGLALGEPRVESLNFLWFYGRRFTEISRMEGSSELKDLGLYPHKNATSNSATTGSNNSLFYISSEQISGPR
uniref:Receptor-like serine/threonine-protein kinase n=1 Tax=Fagus sylvatica TaxID=28930 RepID=A0A2N9I8J8_FAGSY